jgi:hypothetical protein
MAVSQEVHNGTGSNRERRKKKKKRWQSSSEVPLAEIYVKHYILMAKKKYKPVVCKIKPIPSTLPMEFRIIRNITGNLLEHIPTLAKHPPCFEPTGRYTEERKKV